ncbi:MAG TPA: DUF1918 domain-containing protein [Solirubrobacteraceae bacterium]|jgi:hypothetical protein|nr:DUF1918 domain-containing protein [Solirubrobacteraceae bacterium]
MASAGATQTKGRAGDWVEVHGHPGKPSRRGQITEVLGDAGREHYRVRWERAQESIFYPAAGVVIVRRAQRARARSSASAKPATRSTRRRS